MANESITACHVPTGERFEFIVDDVDNVPGCDCGMRDDSVPHMLKKPEGKFDYKAKTYTLTCPACGKRLAEARRIETEDIKNVS